MLKALKPKAGITQAERIVLSQTHGAANNGKFRAKTLW
jgi:hypothetical protein